MNNHFTQEEKNFDPFLLKLKQQENFGSWGLQNVQALEVLNIRDYNVTKGSFRLLGGFIVKWDARFFFLF
jgi:Ran GTPase-activating protein (RanGAP) involved in mRNA processing and transport